MPQTYNVGSRSRFVTFIAWLFLLLAGVACAWAVIQQATLSSWHGLLGEVGGLPWLTALLYRYLPWVFSCAIALSLALAVCSVGLLRRVEWARRPFIGLLGVALGVNLAGLWLQQEFIHLLLDATLGAGSLPQEAAAVFGGVVTAARLLAGAVTLVASAGLVAVIRRLMSPTVRQEFA